MPSTDASLWYAAARDMSRARIRNSYRPELGLFARQLRDGAWAETSATERITSSAACLIACSRAGIAPAALGVDTERCLGAVADALRRERHIGALGLAVWANAVSGGVALEAFLERCGSDLTQLAGLSARFTTMELAWLLSGILHEKARSGSRNLDGIAANCTAALLRRQPPCGLLLHAERGAPTRAYLRRRVATFADQIYSIQALAFMAIGEGQGDALDGARRCGQAIAERQGERGQWWWHYDPAVGRVTRRYPVYAVHQYGMAPMAFLALEKAGGGDHRDCIWSGLNWLEDNEIDTSMLDAEAQTIWRDIELTERKAFKLLRDCSEIIGLREGETPPPALRLNRETRPYEWAWCLMASAQLSSPPPAGHIA